MFVSLLNVEQILKKEITPLREIDMTDHPEEQRGGHNFFSFLLKKCENHEGKYVYPQNVSRMTLPPLN